MAVPAVTRLAYNLKQQSAGGVGISRFVGSKEELHEQGQIPQQASEDIWTTTEACQDPWPEDAIEARPNDQRNGGVESNTVGGKRPLTFEDENSTTKKCKQKEEAGSWPEPPLLAPLVQAIAVASANFNITNESIAVMFRRLLAARNESATVSGQISQVEDMPLTTRRRALHRVLVDRLMCAGSEAIPLQHLELDPVLTALRWGVAHSIHPILQEKPQCYQIMGEADSTGKTVQAVRLLGGGLQGMCAEAPGSPELLFQRLVAGLQARGGYSSVSQLGQDPVIREASKGVASKLTKFLEKYCHVFQVGPDGATGELMVHLVSIPPMQNGPSILPGPVPKQDGQRLLMEQIASVIETSGGTCCMSALGCAPGVMEHRKGVAASLGKFLASHPGIFEKVADSSTGDTVWSLVNGWNVSASFTGSSRPEASPAKTSEQRQGDAEAVRQEIVQFLEARGGEAPLQKLGEQSSIKYGLRGVAAKMSKFLQQHPETFEVVLAGDPAVLTCRLVSTLV